MNILASLTLANLLVLTFPVFTSMLKFSLMDFPTYITKTIKFSFTLSLISMVMFFYLDYDYSVFNWHWMTTQSISLVMSFKMDLYSMLFIPIALFVTWSIMEFSSWYMHSDPDLNRFIKYLLLFLITMMILVTANNLLQLFIGWEGVGIMSFLLIGWWYGRSDANSAALQAILYNRIGDIGLILSISWFALKCNSVDLQTIMNTKYSTNSLPLFGLLLAAMGKSAQFGLHPWLPSAMEGPTPVSALLHSSTMVVAGIFLLIRFFPILDNCMMKLSMLLIGSTTALFTALCAITQNDIKKIIAFSTSSQLGLMMVTLGIGSPYLAFLHICTHAFFKAALFLCSGSIIHNLNDEQDIRKMGGLAKTLPMTSSFLTIGSLALTGMPFLTGFYSKDLIIESLNSSYINAWALLITLIATSLTAVYSVRIMFFVFSNHPRMLPVVIINENNVPLIRPIKRLIMGSLFAGFLMYNFIPPIITPPMTMPMILKTTAILVSILGLTLAMELNNLTFNLTTNYPSNPTNFLSLLGFYPNLFHRLFPSMNLKLSQKYAHKLLDSTWLELTLPKTLVSLNLLASTTTSNQKGLIKLYFLSILLIIPIPTLLLLT